MKELPLAIRGLLKNDADVYALVGNRITPVFRPQAAAMPAVVYSQISDTGEHTRDGALGIPEARIEISCISDSWSESQDLADKVRLVLDGYSGTAYTTTILTTFRESISEDYIPPQSSEETGVFVVTIDFMIRYREATS